MPSNISEDNSIESRDGDSNFYSPAGLPIITQDIDPASLPTDEPQGFQGNILDSGSLESQPEQTGKADATTPLDDVDATINHDNLQRADIIVKEKVIEPVPQSMGYHDIEEEDASESEITDEDKLHAFLKTSKKENQNMAFRRGLLMQFIPSKNKINPSQFFVSCLKENILLMDLIKFFCRAIYFRPNQFRVDECADMLLKLWLLTKLQDEHHLLHPNSTYRESKPVKALRTFIESCLDRITNDVDHATKSKRKRNLLKKSKGLSQSAIVTNEGAHWSRRIEPYTCPKCQHSNVISVVPVEILVQEYSLLEIQYKQDMEEYHKNVHLANHKKDGTRKIKPTKLYDEPKRPNFPKQQMACMCCVTKCRNIVDGRGCHHCNGLAKSNIAIPFDVKKAECECALCQCECDIEFPKTSWQTIAAQEEEEKIENQKENESKKMKVFMSGQEGEFL